MKRINLVRTFVALALLGTMSACLPVQPDPNGGFGADGKLALNGTVSEATIVTRAASDADLKEKDLNTLDVFVEHVGDEGKFMRLYHLVGTTDAPIQEQVNNLLAEHWQNEGLEYGEKYNIYVAANNSQTKKVKVEDLTTFDVTALKRLMVDEVAEGIAVLDDDGNIGWGTDTTSGNIFKLYDANPGSDRALTKAKEFMMDGVIENWTPDQTKRDQVFEVTLNRAAAKFVVNVKFDADFLTSLEAEGASITGSPAWKFYNFAFGAPVFAPEEQGAGIEVHNSGFNIFYNESCEGGTPFTITTYSYPNKWDAANYATDAPSLVISIGYKEKTGKYIDGKPEMVTNYHYYRIPLVKSTVTEIERNHIYAVTATIATKGSATQVDPIVTEDIEYKVLPWNDASNSAAIQNNVQSIQHYYFRVNPKIYTLRGDGDQSVTLNYSKATGTKVNWKLFTYDEKGEQTGVVAHDAEDVVPIRAWFYNASGEFTTTYSDNESGVDWSNTGNTPMGVSIVQSTEGTGGSSGTVTVTSHALNNRAIKYIRLRVYLDEPATFKDGKETMYEDIIIRHFPTDNIQNIVGSWSSYTPAGGGTVETTLTTTDLSEARAWVDQYEVPYSSISEEEKTGTEYISYAEYSAHLSEAGYSMTGPTASSYDFFHTAVQDEANRQRANSQANAVADGGEGHNYYWGTEARMVEENSSYYRGQYDYRIFNHQGSYYTYYDYYKYTNYYTATYTHSYTYTEYSLTVQISSTGNWVDWERDEGKTYNQANVKYTRATIFTAKVFNKNNGNIYAIEPVRSGSYNNYQYTYRIATSQAQGGYYTYYEGGGNNAYGNDRSGGMTNLKNNHMYVIQISSTSEGYVMGRPILGNPNQYLSQDDVVSPAFMIASQLGAVTTTDNNQVAATHCSRYMEVAADGTRYTGWRLPTPDEISVITRYQQGTINGVTISDPNYQAMTPVLTGRYYWSLSGNSVETSSQYSGGTYLRCVRDLSAKEVEDLNGFDKIIEKYSKK